jgi:hypothetical protein
MVTFRLGHTTDVGQYLCLESLRNDRWGHKKYSGVLPHLVNEGLSFDIFNRSRYYFSTSTLFTAGVALVEIMCSVSAYSS